MVDGAVFRADLGWLVLLIFLCQEGTEGPNRFGEDPRDGGLSAVFS
jgi:uncharacterized membrane protein YhaH (DUF805 family)